MGKGIKTTGNQKKNQDFPDYSMVDIALNKERMSASWRPDEICCHSDSKEKH